MTTTKINLPPKLKKLFTGKALYRAAYGGRGAGKTFSFALMAAVYGYKFGKSGRSGVLVCSREFKNSLTESSFTQVKKAIESHPFLMYYYEIGSNYIRSKDGRIKFAFRGVSRNPQSFKSITDLLLLWIDEAEETTEEAYIDIIPTVRENDSEMWVTWNPKHRGSATEKRFRINDEDVKSVEINYNDNPYFTKRNEKTRQSDKKTMHAEIYHHIWEGGYLDVIEGGILKREYFGRYYAFPRLVKESFIVIDTAETAKTYSDYTSMMYAGKGYAAEDGQEKIFIFDIVRFKAEYVEVEERTIEFWKKHMKGQGNPYGASNIRIEAHSSGGSLISRLKSKGIPAIAISRKKPGISAGEAKYSRLLDVMPTIAGNNVVLPDNPIKYHTKNVTDAEWVDPFLRQCVQFTAIDKHENDDMVDNLIDLCAALGTQKKWFPV